MLPSTISKTIILQYTYMYLSVYTYTYMYPSVYTILPNERQLMTL